MVTHLGGVNVADEQLLPCFDVPGGSEDCRGVLMRCVSSQKKQSDHRNYCLPNKHIHAFLICCRHAC